ncbi:MAG: flavin reductase [Lachnospiraceae bacterium]|nr:flavin reductase [Lachnospiraceae bacterium]
MNTDALFKLGYGLYLITAKDEIKDNGCIINTVMQVTASPNRIVAVVNKSNYTHDMIKSCGKFNISVLSNEADFDLIKQFGFVSGKETDKFTGYSDIKRSENGLLYLTKKANAYLSGTVTDMIDVGTHTMFVAELADAQVLNDIPSMTYEYYHANVKPKAKPQEKIEKKNAYVCKICGFVYHGDSLPEDYICPICKHGAEDFEKVNA